MSVPEPLVGKVRTYTRIIQDTFGSSTRTEPAISEKDLRLAINWLKKELKNAKYSGVNDKPFYEGDERWKLLMKKIDEAFSDIIDKEDAIK